MAPTHSSTPDPADPYEHLEAVLAFPGSVA
jgi:hypothetical protein